MMRITALVAGLLLAGCRAPPPPDAQAITDEALLVLVELTGKLDDKPDAKIAALRQVKAAVDRAGARRARIAADSLLGENLAAVRQIEEAVALLTGVLEELRTAPDVEAEVHAHVRLGLTYYFSGAADKVLHHLERGLELARAHGLQGLEALILHRTGLLYIWVMDDAVRGLLYVTAALVAYQRLGDPHAVFGTRVGVAAGQRRMRDHEAALATLLPALETARAGVARGELGRWEFKLLEVLLELGPTYSVLGRHADARAVSDEAAALGKKRGDDTGWSHGRFNFAEAAMKDGLWDEAEVAVGEVIAATAAREAAVTDEKIRLPLTRALRNLQQLLVDILVGRGDVERAFAASEKLRSRRLLAALGTDEIVDAAGARRLLGDGTTLVEYAITGYSAFAFIVDAVSVRALRLGTSAQVSGAARSWYDLASVPDASPEKLDAAARALADLIVAPVVPHIGGRRVAFVADKALHYVAFGGLPLPGGGRLIERYEVVHLPSASVLAALRKRGGARPRATRELAILADPIFDRGDARAGGTRPPAAMLASLRAAEAPADLPRLVASGAEAEAIAGLVPAGRRFLAQGRDATREAALGPDVAGARLVHFATHAVLDNADPDRSGLVFTQIDDAGDPVDGFLRVPDIQRLRLAADVVVLSACRTAIGKRFDGEGLVGLTRAFFIAGAPRVVSSLWQVDDAATAALMGRFYGGLLRAGLSPAAALRRAQLEVGVAKDAPVWLWAAFAFHGDWR